MTLLHGANASNLQFHESAGVPYKALEFNSLGDMQTTRFIRQEIIDDDSALIHMFTNRAV